MVASCSVSVYPVYDATDINHTSYKVKSTFGNLLSSPSCSQCKDYDCAWVPYVPLHLIRIQSHHSYHIHIPITLYHLQLTFSFFKLYNLITANKKQSSDIHYALSRAQAFLALQGVQCSSNTFWPRNKGKLKSYLFDLQSRIINMNC